MIKIELIMHYFKNLEKNRLLPVFISSLVFIVLFAFSGNLIHFTYADATFTAAGDWGCNSNTDDTVDNMVARNPGRAFGLGDYSYASTGSCWWNRLTPALDSAMEIAFGNHEDESSEGLSGYQSHFGSQTYYAYTHDVVRVIVMDTDVASPSGSAQKSFVQSQLQSASTDSSIKWIIVYLHKPFYTSPNSCSSTGCTNSNSDTAGTLRNNYGAWFDQYGVDLVLQGHVHNYQRTFQLKYNPGSPSSPTIGSNNANTYTEGNGAVYAIVGTGGQGFHPLSGKASFVSTQQDDDFGQMQIKVIDNGNKLEGKFFPNGANSAFDTFSITKAGNSPPVANPQTVTVNKNTAKSITLTATDPNNDPLTYSIVTQPLHGTLSPSTPGGPARTYTPATGYVGPDSFTFKANDGTVDSNTATVSINVIEPTSCGTNLPISGVTASASSSSYPPANVLDNNLNTRWSNTGIGSWIRADLGSTQNICSVDIAWPFGTIEQYHFVIATSTDGTTFTNKFSGDSSGTTLNSEKYTFASTNARYVRVTVNGNTNPSFPTVAAIAELDIFGSGSSQPPSSCTTNFPISGVTASASSSSYPPANVLDNNLNTRWSNTGIGSWIRADLGSTQNICSVDIAWPFGTIEQYHFVIATSTDGTTFTNKFSGDSSGTTLNSEKYTIPSTDARYIRVTVNGNTNPSFPTVAAIAELDIFGASSSLTSSSLYNFGPSLTLSGPGG
jgi:F5/8 type C domain-containing protein/Big-like domain-containing protein/calcineurin-like phosphoesterase family protein